MINQVRQCAITGYGTYLPKQALEFTSGTRYRASGDETQLSMATAAARSALKQANMAIGDIDCIVAASAVGIQPIPCTAALIHEQLAKSTSIPALDINTTCTSFLTALDTMSYLVAAGRYRHVLIISSEIGSLGLNPEQPESYELFSDGAAAVILSHSDKPTQGIRASLQRTWSEGAHATEIRGGLTGLPPSKWGEHNKADYLFDMDGRTTLRLAGTKLPEMFEEFQTSFHIDLATMTMVIPHQASRALGMIMRRIGVPKGKYIDWVSDYGNMVSVSVPFVLCRLLEQKRLTAGDKVLLCGTAAGLTANIIVMEL